MTRKRNTKTKKSVSKTKKEVDINDIDAMLEDMKHLAMDETVNEENDKDEVTVSQPEVMETKLEMELENTDTIISGGSGEIEEKYQQQVDDNYYTEIPTEQQEKEANTENNDVTESIENVSEEVSDDLSFVDEIKEEEEIIIKEEKTEEKPKPKKPKRKTYQEMFGGTWRGYGYDHF